MKLEIQEQDRSRWPSRPRSSAAAMSAASAHDGGAPRRPEAAARTSPATSTITRPAPTARSRCRSWSRSRSTRRTRPGVSTGSCRPATAAAATAIARWPKMRRSRRPPIRSCSQPTARPSRVRTRAGRTPIRRSAEGPRVRAPRPTRSMWRWQSIQEFQYPLTEYLAALKSKPVFMGLESVVAGHEHTSMSVITGQMPGRHLHAAAADERGLRAARQCHCAEPVVVLLRSRRHGHEPRQHDRRRYRGQQLELLGGGQRQRSGSELERGRAEADARRAAPASASAATRRPSRR